MKLQTFEWEGVQYEFDSSKCMSQANIIILPDGTRLRVSGWKLCAPPKPVGITKMSSRKAQGISATKVVQS